MLGPDSFTGNTPQEIGHRKKEPNRQQKRSCDDLLSN